MKDLVGKKAGGVERWVGDYIPPGRFCSNHARLNVFAGHPPEWMTPLTVILEFDDGEYWLTEGDPAAVGVYGETLDEAIRNLFGRNWRFQLSDFVEADASTLGPSGLDYRALLLKGLRG